jgi:tRNA(Ile)-lysidine synthase
MTPAPDLLERFRRDLDALIGPGASLGLAVSGGPDSVALLLLAAAIRPVEAATVDHGLRAGSAHEAAMVARLCRERNVAHRILKLDWTEPLGSSVQAQARERRYQALECWALERGLTAVATAHHVDDQAETLLMRVARGAGAGGLAGIQPRRAIRQASAVQLVRPLLGWRRDELRAIVAAAAIDPVADPGNDDEQFDRTRARRLLADTPWLEAPRLAASAAHLADAGQALDWAAEREFAVRWNGTAGTLDPGGLPRELKRRLLLKALRSLGCDAPAGPKLMSAIDVLDAGGVTTLAGLKLEGGPPWRLSPAPPRR